jgi:mRNA interferase MazF
MKYKIVLVPFTFDDLSEVKVRPAVCLTNPVGIHRHLIIGFISSRIPTEILSSDIIVSANDTNFSLTGLRVTSTIRLHRLMTTSTRVIIRELGILLEQLQKVINDKLKLVFEL